MNKKPSIKESFTEAYNKKPTKKDEISGAIFLIFLITIGYFFFFKEDEKKTQTKIQNICEKDLDCIIEKHKVDAWTYCTIAIEELPNYAYRWTNSWIVPKFSKWTRININDTFVILTGDDLEVQNEYGAWQRYTYECLYDFDLKEVLGVHVEHGRMLK